MDEEGRWYSDCADSGGPSGSTLMQVADNEAEPDLSDQVLACPNCRQQVEQLQWLQNRLRACLYRATCPSSDELADFCQGLLGFHERSTIVHHITVCPHCAAEVLLLQQTDESLGVSVRGPNRSVSVRPSR